MDIKKDVKTEVTDFLKVTERKIDRITLKV